MSTKGRKKGSQAARARQQQEAAAKRRAPGPAAGRAGDAQSTPARQTTAKPAPGETRDYLDVSAVRIQEWLSRTPDLRFWRGGSVLLSEATGRDAWSGERLPGGVRWNDEAGDLDGVVCLVADGPAPDLEIEDRLGRAAREIAASIRERMPYCLLQAVSGRGDSYAAAYTDMERARRVGDFLVDSPAAPPETILAKPCDQCRSAAAVHPEILIGDRSQDLCDDCHRRFEAAGGTKGDGPRSPRPERRMKQALRDAGLRAVGFPDDFQQMARDGRLFPDDKPTQLGLIYADGNKVGAFLSEAAGHARKSGKPGKAEIVPALDGATLAALADAAANRFGEWSRPPVLAHIAGGDDLLVSVPAIDAWMFVRTLLRAFGTRLGQASAAWPTDVRELLPSLSAGLVFHHFTAPFSDVVRLAKGQLRKAKEAERGGRPAVSFLDLTADGGHEPAGRRALTLDELDWLAPLLGDIEKIPRSRRETLVTLHRRIAEDAVLGAGGDLAHRGTGTPAGEFVRRLTDFDGNKPLWEAVTGKDAGLGRVRAVLTQHPEKLGELRRLLDMARYWRTEPRPEPARGELAARHAGAGRRGEER